MANREMETTSWTLERWMANAKYWKEQWDVAIEQRDLAIGFKDISEKEVATLRAELETVKRERDEAVRRKEFLEDAWMQDETIVLGRELRPTLQKTLKRAEAAESQAARLKEALEWVKVSERLPEDGTSVLVYVPGFEDGYLLYRVAWIDYDETPPRWIFNGEILDGVTHWQSLPHGPGEALQKEANGERG